VYKSLFLTAEEKRKQEEEMNANPCARGTGFSVLRPAKFNA